MKIKPPTDDERKSWPKTVIVQQEKPFADARGEMLIPAMLDLLGVAVRIAVALRHQVGAMRRADAEGVIATGEFPPGQTSV